MSATARPIVLVGLMGSGKTTVGRALARELGVPFVDNDVTLEAREGHTAGELAAALGADAVHRAEAAVARAALADDKPRVVALAASVVDDGEIVASLRDHDVVWLRASPSTLQRRLAGSPTHRPAAADLGETLDEQARRRCTALRDVAGTIIDVERRTPDDIVRAILAALVATGSGDAPRVRAGETGSSPS